ncbi:Conglutinin [Folsomia candida]|uniref:Conglutinin n=1 Tax=Folsomia candida TaxID=158441 RepID=A0A226EB81_FOLCA|nr:Conglutinin [Folsomia candida]
MTLTAYFVAAVILCQVFEQATAISCGGDWISFEDSKCLRFYDNFETKEVAEETCASIPTEPLNIALNDTHFVWRDGDWMSFTNWDDGFPTNQTVNLCMEMSPKAGRQAEVDATEDGKWKDVPCSKRNLVVCEKKPMLTVPELQEILFQLRDNPVPIGFIYVQLPFHPSPQTLWPNLIWRNVYTSTYSGLFFRTEGGTAAPFGTVQTESSNRLRMSSVSYATTTSYPTSINVPTSGWSGYVMSGENPTTSSAYDGLRFQNSGTETRPRNAAVRIWERI